MKRVSAAQCGPRLRDALHGKIGELILTAHSDIIGPNGLRRQPTGLQSLGGRVVGTACVLRLFYATVRRIIINREF